MTITYSGDSAHTVPLDPPSNLITKTALQIAAANHVEMPPCIVCNTNLSLFSITGLTLMCLITTYYYYYYY